MVNIIPFKGIVYNKEKIKDISLVTAPPYDVISGEGIKRLTDKSPYNIVRILLSKDEPNKDRYSAASTILNKWMEDDVLIKDERPSFYFYVQNYVVDGVKKTRKGFITLLKLEEYGPESPVIPHEKTLLGPKKDRLKLMEACNAHLSPVFGVYSDAEKKINSVFEDATADSEIFFEVKEEDGTENKLWKMSDPDSIELITGFMKEKYILIADGHHRYETALAYRDKMRAKTPQFSGREPFNYVMIYLSNMDDEGFTILPTHRLVHSLEDFKAKAFLINALEFFLVEEVKFNEEMEEEVRRAFYKKLELRGRDMPAFGLFINGIDSFFILTLKSFELISKILRDDLPEEIKRLDLTVLHSFILNKLLGISEDDQANQRNIVYIKDREEALKLVKTDKHQMAFILNPPSMQRIVDAAKTRGRMPQKSTYFYPKLLSGLVIHKM